MPLCRVSVVKLRAIPLSTITTLGPVPISQPRVLLTQFTASWFNQEKGVTELLNAGLQAIGGGHGPVATAGLSAHEKDSLPFLSANDEAGFDYIRKHQNGGCS